MLQIEEMQKCAVEIETLKVFVLSAVLCYEVDW